MKTLFTIILTLVTSINMLSSDIKIEIKENQKFVQTYSGKLSSQKGFQAYLIKNLNTKTFEFFSFFIDNGEVKPLNKIAFNNNFSIISYHINNNTLSLLIKEERRGSGHNLRVLDINTKTQKYSKKDLGRFDPEKTVLTLSDKTIIFNKKKNKIFFSLIKDSQNIKDKQIEINKENNRTLSPFFKDPYFTAINSDDFVRNGSANNNTVYFNNNNFYFLNLNKHQKSTNVLRINFNNLDLEAISIKNDAFDKIKDFNSYIYNNEVVSVISGKDDAEIKITNFDTNKTEFKISAVKDLTSILNNEKLSNFIKNSSKSKNKPTITVNSSIDNNIVVNLDYVEKQNYYYNNNWYIFWMMDQQRMLFEMNQRANTVQKSFGPKIPDDYFPFVFEKKDKTLMQFVISKDYKIIKNASTKTKYKNIDIGSYMGNYKNDKSKKSLTALFTDDNYFIIYYDKSNKVINLKKNAYDL